MRCDDTAILEDLRFCRHPRAVDPESPPCFSCAAAVLEREAENWLQQFVRHVCGRGQIFKNKQESNTSLDFVQRTAKDGMSPKPRDVCVSRKHS